MKTEDVKYYVEKFKTNRSDYNYDDYNYTCVILSEKDFKDIFDQNNYTLNDEADIDNYNLTDNIILYKNSYSHFKLNDNEAKFIVKFKDNTKFYTQIILSENERIIKNIIE